MSFLNSKKILKKRGFEENNTHLTNEKRQKKKAVRPLDEINIFLPRYKLSSNKDCLIDQSEHLWRQNE